ncbi:hypothetical protein BDP27DRAFT_746059 [Rhodocollybia butyracea]|uniref:DUF7053 domain-containing protein n=1 Tax=Rhodocollybia butyracea TaxID=206335 RepID=A0A9P5U8M6_9AGAR|nr:hypothetical protein BDP27DRAFT_746059 [Rhodocollybia butyracea]
MLRMTWKVARNAETGDLEVSETVICRTLFLLHPFIIGTMSKAHAQMIDRLVEKVQENVKATRGEADGSEGKESEVV